MMHRILPFLILLLLAIAPGTAQAADCQFILGFQTLRDLIGHDIVGDCLENEFWNEIGDSNQRTTGGLMAWRKADNWTAFTDGYRTWINGPNGLVARLNTERFEWEADYAEIVLGATPSPTPVVAPTPTTAVATPTPIPTTPPPTPVPTSSPTSDFDPQEYLGQGDRYNCSDFSYRWQAQAVLDADSSDPNRLDKEKDGTACESLP